MLLAQRKFQILCSETLGLEWEQLFPNSGELDCFKKPETLDTRFSKNKITFYFHRTYIFCMFLYNIDYDVNCYIRLYNVFLYIFLGINSKADDTLKQL